MKHKMSVEFLLNSNLNTWDKECAYEACHQFGKRYGDHFNCTVTYSTIDHTRNFMSISGVGAYTQPVLGEPLLESLIEIQAHDMTFLMITVPIVYVDQGTLPIAMFCYDPDQKKASALLSLDILRSPIKEKYVRSILINVEHEIGEIVLGEHCANKKCPVHFHSRASDMESSSEDYCEKCYKKLLRDLREKFDIE